MFKSYPIDFNYKKHTTFLWNKIKNDIFKYKIMFSAHGCKENVSVLDTHRDQLTNLIIYKYLGIRMFHEKKKEGKKGAIKN